ncbi:MAG: DUF4956 domain-containing protein [Thermodesulfobacteriota bacterium]
MDNLTAALGALSTGELGLSEFFISILFSLFVGIACMFLHRMYFGMNFDSNESLPRSFVVIAPSVSAIFWAIQYSLPLSLGLLGALSFVRFRTPVKKAEDVAFILLVIALSLLSSVFRFYAASILLCLVAVIVLVKTVLAGKAIPLLHMGRGITAFVTTNSVMVEKTDNEIRGALLDKFKGLKQKGLVLNDVVPVEDGYSLRYSLYFKTDDNTLLPSIIEILKSLESLERVEVFYGKTYS